MNSMKRIEEIFRQYEVAGLIDGDPEKVMALLSDKIIGIGLGEQGLVSGKQDILDIMQSSIKQDMDAVYELEFQNIVVSQTSEISANLCAAVYVKKTAKEKTTVSVFWQSLSFVFEQGDWFICCLHASPLFLCEESIESYPMAFVDQTLEQLRLELQEEAFILANQGVSGGMFGTYIAPGRYPLYFANDNFIHMLGYKREEFCSRFQYDLSGVLHPDDKKMLMERGVMAAAKKGEEFETQYRMLKKDGSVVWVIEHGKKSESNEGREIILAVITEVTEMVHMQQMLEEKTVLLEEQAEELATQNEALLLQRKDLEEQKNMLMVSEERFRLALEKTSNIIFDYDFASGEIVCARGAAARGFVFQLRDAEKILMGNNVIAEECLADFFGAFSRVREGEEHAECVVKMKSPDGEDTWNKISMTSVIDENGVALRAVGLIEDITKQIKMEMAYKQEEQYRQAIVADTMGVYVVNFSKGIFESCHIMDERCLKAEAGEGYNAFLLQKSERCLNEKDRQAFLDLFSRASVMAAFDEGRQELKLEYLVKFADGSDMWMQTIMRLVTDTVTHERKGFIYVMDIDERKRKEASLTLQSETDPLTGLYHKTATKERIMERLLQEGPLLKAFIMIDIDFFKDVNDSLGHPFGDKVLQEVAEALQGSFGEDSVAGRFGGDEFCVFTLVRSEGQLAKMAEAFLKQVRAIPIPKETLTGITCSMGIALCTGQGETFEQLYQEADSALYDVKEHGRDSYAFFGRAHGMESQRWMRHAEWLLDEMQLAIYVCDLETYQVIYLNDYLLSFLKLDRKDCYQKKCYEVLCKLDAPCPFCSMQKIKRDEVYQRFFELPNTGRQFLIRGQMVNWNGRLAHLEIASDVTDIVHSLCK